ncbi:MAG: EAL domain-containing protein [Acidimicrobiia bacterium]|nr:EAL domain-containing protein [Acidimicrobiia bacterium]
MRNWKRRSRRASVAVYLIGTFGVCIAALAALVAVTTASSFRRERDRATTELRAAAQVNADSASATVPEMLGFVGDLAKNPALASLDPAQCQASLGTLASVLSSPAEQGHIELYRPDGSLVCTLASPGSHTERITKGAWFDKVLATNSSVDGGTGIDPLTGQPSFTIALPVAATGNRTGVMAVSMATGSTPLQRPAGAAAQTVLVELDPSGSIVLATSDNAPVRVGPVKSWPAAGTSGTRSLTDADGVSRIYTEVTATNGWHVLAGIPTSAAQAPARAELQRNLLFGGAIVALVAGLGFLLGRRLARPVRRLRQTIEAAKADNTVTASLEGPAEIAAVAEAFNETIAERRDLESQLSHQALHDPLTGLANRALLDDRLRVALARRRHADAGLAVMFFDVDRFKVINDSHGHDRGDVVLVGVARRLEQALRSGDTLARFGGDEFVVLAEEVASEREAFELASRLQEAICRPLTLDSGETAHVTATVGIAIADVGSTAGELLRDADAAMYRGKERGRARAEIFDEELGARARKRAETEAALRAGLARGEFVVHYQPEVDVQTGQMTGVEALARWNRPHHGMVSPGEFIPVAEETGLILDLGDLVLEQACRQAVAWRLDGLDLTMSVNLSPRQLTDPDLPKRISAILARTGAPPHRLVLEMTESGLVENDPRTMAVLQSLKGMGVRLALDDFGTGYASLSYLRHFPVDVVKVDRSFVSDLGTGEGAIVAAVLAMGRGLGLTTVAEGVEEPEQLAALEEMGCALAQGFYLAKPQAPEVIPTLARRNLRLGGGVQDRSRQGALEPG